MNAGLPNFLIIGAAKCGTTALATILGQHPDCCISNPKEVSYFQDTVDFAPNPNFEKGLDWYRKAFLHYNGEAHVGEATPSYSDRSRSPGTAKRIHQFDPKMRLIYMTRDPLERQISTWQMFYMIAKQELSLSKREYEWALKGFSYWLEMQRDVRQWDVSRYAFQLKAYQDHFPPAQILVMALEDWKVRQNEEINRAMKFLGLEPSAVKLEGTEHANRLADRTIQRPLIKQLRSVGFVRAVINRAPKSIRRIAHQKISLSKERPPEIDMHAPIVSEFVDYVFDDCMAFLQNIGRAPEIWPTLKARSDASLDYRFRRPH